MEEEDNKHTLLQPLIPFLTTTTSSSIATAATSSYSLLKSNQHYDEIIEDTTSSNNTKLFLPENTIILRIFIVFFVAIISIWANYEASKTFEINIVNDTKDSPAGRRFALFYVSNDKVSRIVLNTSNFVEHILYPHNNKNYPKKHIDTVTLRLASQNLAAAATVSATEKSQRDYVIDISPMLLENENFNKVVIVGAVQRAMAKVWLWDGGSRAPHGLVDGMAEYVAELAGFRRESSGSDLPECGGQRWWEDKDPRHVAHLLHYFEKCKKGFIQRLNEAMRDTWHDRMVDDVLGMPAMKLCGLHNASRLNLVI